MKKVLIISYYWPPAGGPGAIRVVKFAKYLLQFGWQPVVLTVEKGEFPYLDPSLEKEIPPTIPVYRSPAFDPFRFYKKFTGKARDETIPVAVLTHRNRNWRERLAAFVRSNLFVPDARVGWVPFAARMARNIIRKENINLVFISSPPHSSQLIGLRLKKQTAIPWVADFRDPWTEIKYYQFVKRWKVIQQIDRDWEKKVLSFADRITTVSKTLVQSFAQRLAQGASEKFIELPNGYDELDFEGLPPAPEDETFDILHTGNLQDHQNPSILWDALKRMILENRERERIRVQLIGRTHPSILQEVEAKGLQQQVTARPFIPHKEIPPLLKKADLLLVVVPRVENNRSIVTGKVFEYLGARTPILAIGPPEGDLGTILKPIPNCRIIDYTDADTLYEYLTQAFEQWKQQQWRIEDSWDPGAYSRKSLTRQLAELFNTLVPTPPG
ncbi:MAG: glycosyltransferase [Calditrichia bacterium]